MSAEQSAKLTPQLLMGQIDADADGKASRPELIDMLRRMKGFDAGHIQRGDAATPSGTIGEDEQIYGRSLLSPETSTLRRVSPVHSEGQCPARQVARGAHEEEEEEEEEVGFQGRGLTWVVPTSTFPRARQYITIEN